MYILPYRYIKEVLNLLRRHWPGNQPDAPIGDPMSLAKMVEKERSAVESETKSGKLGKHAVDGWWAFAAAPSSCSDEFQGIEVVLVGTRTGSADFLPFWSFTGTSSRCIVSTRRGRRKEPNG